MKKFNPESETKKIIPFIQEQQLKQKTKGATIGLSGGVDSAVCATLLVKALGQQNVLGIAIPEKDSSPEDLNDAKFIAKYLGIRLQIVSLTPLLEMFGVYDYMKGWNWEKIKQYYLPDSKEVAPTSVEYPMVMKLRGRGYILSDVSKRLNLLLCQTINKTEWLFGMFDKFGDTIGDIALIWHLYKTEVFVLAEYLKIPKRIITREPTSGLMPISFTETEEMGMSHKDMDEILYYLDTQQNKTFVENKFSKKTIDRVRNCIENSEIKRQIPIQM